MFELLSSLGVVLVIVSPILIFIINDWRWNIISLATLYLGVFALVSLSWPISLTLVKLITGWMCGAILGMALTGQPGSSNSSGNLQNNGTTTPEPKIPTSYRVFRVFIIVMFVLVVFSVSPALERYIPGINTHQTLGALFLVGLGLLQVGYNTRVFPLVLGLLTILAGFEIIYAVVESSTLVSGLLAVVNLGVALAGAYLIVSSGGENTA